MGMLNLMCSPCVGGHQVSEGLKLARTYWIVCPKAASTKPKVATFRDWLLAEAADDARRLRKYLRANARIEAKPIPREFGSFSR